MMKEMKVLAAALLAAVALPLSAPAEAGDLHLDLRIPVGLYGWTPLGGDWADTIAGAAGVRAGLEVFPPRRGARLLGQGHLPVRQGLRGLRHGVLLQQEQRQGIHDDRDDKHEAAVQDRQGLRRAGRAHKRGMGHGAGAEGGLRCAEHDKRLPLLPNMTKAKAVKIETKLIN